MQQLKSSRLITSTILLSTLSIANSLGQTNLFPIGKTDSFITLGFESILINESSTAPARLVNTFLWGPKIAPPTKETILNKTKAQNRIGFIGLGKLSIPLSKNISTTNRSILVEFKTLYGIKYSKNLLSLLMEGNQQFDNQTLDLGKNKAETWSYMKYGYGIRKLSPSRIYDYGLSANILLDYQRANLNSANLLTSSNLNLLNASFEGEYQGVSNNTPLINGFGFGLDYSVRILKFQSSYKFSVSNIGFTTIFSPDIIKPNTYEYTFRGVEINNLLNSNESPFSAIPNPIDSLSLETKASKIILNPFTTEAFFCQKLNNNYTLCAGGDYLYIYGYAPKGRISLNKKVKSFDLTGTLAYGGFSNLSYGIGSRYSTNLLQISLILQTLGGIIQPDKVANSSFGISVSYFLNGNQPAQAQTM